MLKPPPRSSCKVIIDRGIVSERFGVHYNPGQYERTTFCLAYADPGGRSWSNVSCVIFGKYAKKAKEEINPGDQLVVIGSLKWRSKSGIRNVVVDTWAKVYIGDATSIPEEPQEEFLEDTDDDAPAWG